MVLMIIVRLIVIGLIIFLPWWGWRRWKAYQRELRHAEVVDAKEAVADALALGNEAGKITTSYRKALDKANKQIRDVVDLGRSAEQ